MMHVALMLAVCIRGSAAATPALKVREDGAMNTYYLTPEQTNVSVDDGSSLKLGYGRRVYLATNPNLPNSSSRASDFKQFSLLGKEINVTVDLNGAGCGCNVAFYTVSMPALTPGLDKDWYCDANSVGGNSCPEMDLLEVNQHAMHTTPHVCKKPWGNSTCDKGGFAAKFGQGSMNFGLDSGFRIDTSKPFIVSNAFSSSGSTLESITTRIVQGGNTVTKTLDTMLLGGMEKDISNGMVLVMSYWGASSMGWLDRPPCSVDDPSKCPASITFSDISVGPAAPSSAKQSCCSWDNRDCGPSAYCNGNQDQCEGDCSGKWVPAPASVSQQIVV